MNIPIGLRYMVMSGLAFSLMAVCVKLSFAAGIPVLEIVAFRAFISCVLSYIDIRRKKLSMKGRRVDLLLARGGVGALALICVYYGIVLLPLAEATIIQYLHPMFAAILGLLFLKERIGLGTVWCVLLSMIGLVLVVQPFDALTTEGLPHMGVLLALVGAFGSAIAYVLVRKLSASDHPSVIIIYFPLIALPLSLILLGDGFVVPQGMAWLWLVLVGVFTQLGQIGLTVGMQTETAGRATAMSYLQVVFAVVLGYLVFMEVPGTLVLVGSAFILLGALLNVVLKPKSV